MHPSKLSASCYFKDMATRIQEMPINSACFDCVGGSAWEIGIPGSRLVAESAMIAFDLNILI
jgi:hypothetical protein